MLTKEELLASIRHENHVIKHIAAQIPADRLDWRPTPGQRSTRELLQYLSAAALIPATNINSADWEHAPELMKEAGTLDPVDFAAAMDRQLARVEELFSDWNEEALRAAPHTQPWGAPITKSQATVDLVLKTYVAYRMQLFLYAKQSGGAELSTADCWVGVTRPGTTGPIGEGEG